MTYNLTNNLIVIKQLNTAFFGAKSQKIPTDIATRLGQLQLFRNRFSEMWNDTQGSTG